MAYASLIWAILIVAAMVAAMSVSAVLVAGPAAVTLLLPVRTAPRPAPVPEA